MSDPYSWAMIIGAVVSGVASYQQGKAQEKMYRAQADINEMNAENEAQNAIAAGQAANAREEQQRRAARQVLGEQKAALAQAGIGMGGSAADIAEQSAINAEMDALGIRYEGEMERRQFLQRSTAFKHMAGVDRANAGMAGKNARLGLASAALMAGTYAYAGYSQRPGSVGGIADKGTGPGLQYSTRGTGLRN